MHSKLQNGQSTGQLLDRVQIWTVCKFRNRVIYDARNKIKELYTELYTFVCACDRGLFYNLLLVVCVCVNTLYLYNVR